MKTGEGGEVRILLSGLLRKKSKPRAIQLLSLNCLLLLLLKTELQKGLSIKKLLRNLRVHLKGWVHAQRGQ